MSNEEISFHQLATDNAVKCKKKSWIPITDSLISLLWRILMSDIWKVRHTVKSTDPTIVASATIYSGNVVRMVQVVSDEAGAVYAEHWKQKRRKKNENRTA